MGLWKDKTRKHWCYSFQYQTRTHAGRGFQTKKEAVAAREEKRKELKNQPASIGMGYLEACNLYLDHALRKFSTGTYKHKKYVYKCFFEFMKNDLLLSDITPQIIQKYLSTRHSNHNYNAHRKNLSALFNYAMNTLEAVGRNPCEKVSNLPHTAKVKQIPAEKEIVRLLIAADPKTDEKDLLIVLLHTLARIDEILRLTWDDINFKKRILIKRTKKTKDGSYKNIPVNINDELYQTLWDRWEKRTQDRWVFYNERTSDRFYHRPKFMRGLCERAGIKPHFGFHALRHLMASLMGDNPKISTGTIQRILGHSKITTTEIYLHSIDGAIESAMDSISGQFTVENEDPQPKPATKIKKVSGETLETLDICGGSDETRTRDLLRDRQAF